MVQLRSATAAMTRLAEQARTTHHAFCAAVADARVLLERSRGNLNAAQTDWDTEVDLANVRRPQAVIDRIQSQTIEVADNVPMNAGIGLYHRLQNDWDFTVDVMWMEFSDFGVTDVYMEEGTLNVPQGMFNDFYMVTSCLLYTSPSPRD